MGGRKRRHVLRAPTRTVVLSPWLDPARFPPNTANDRPIGLNAQYIAPHMRQTKHQQDSALLVYGHDRYGYYAADIPTKIDLEAGALPRWAELERYHAEIGR